MKKFWSYLLLLWITVSGLLSQAQDIDYARFVMDTLSAPGMHGRGYVKYGAHRAAEFLVREFYNLGARPFNDSYSQEFRLDINTFPGGMMANIDGKVLEPGTEFIVHASSPTVNQVFDLVFVDAEMLENNRKFNKLLKTNLTNSMLVFDRSQMAGISARTADSALKSNFFNASGYMLINAKNNLVWSIWPGFEQRQFPVIEVREDVMPRKPSRIALTIEAEFMEDVLVRNVIAQLKGSHSTDTCIVFTAHYDHLGRMGQNTCFPGANDNASGVAMLLDLARHFSDSINRPSYNLVFMALAAEEMGLLGSEYYVKHPLFPLNKIKVLVNLDMVGTGSEGITVVNGAIYPEMLEFFRKINQEKQYLSEIAMRGESCNSDHCPFYKAGVPSVFIYTRGNEHREYHSPYDQSHRVPLSRYNELFRLLQDFILTY